MAEKPTIRPEVEEGQCASVLLTTLRGQPGVVSATLDTGHHKVRLRFDPEMVSEEAAVVAGERTAAELSFYRQGCPGDGGAHCATCVARLNGMIGTGNDAAQTDQFTLKLGPEVASALELEYQIARPADVKAHAAEEESEVRQLLISTVLCALFLAAGYGASLLGTSEWLHNILYTLSYVSGGYLRMVDGVRNLVRSRRLDINFLMLIGAAGAAVLGRWEEGAVLMFLFTLSATLEGFAVGRTRQAIRKLMALAPEDALVRRGGREHRVPVAELITGDLVIAGPGERIAADGLILRGSSAINEAAITGESIPVEKEAGHKVFAGTVNGHGVIEFQVSKAAAESTLARIIRVVEEAQSQKASTQRLTDWIDRYYTLIVISVAALAWVLPPLFGWDSWGGSFYRAMMLLVVASPCALVISTPAAILSAIARSARAGILFKGGRHLEQAALVQVIALDKTGTLTTGRPGVIAVTPLEGMTEEELLRLAAAAESRSEHPLAAAVLRAARERGILFPLASEFQAMAGLGGRAVVDGQEIFIGAPRFLERQGITASAAVEAQLKSLYDSGLTTMVVIGDGRLLGILGLADTPRAEAKAALAHLKKIGVRRIVMLTGDNKRAAQMVAEAVGVDEVRAELLPEDKLRIIKELEAQYGSVAMVGDGVNDAPALAAATVGIAMGGVGSDVAMETADLVLMADELEKLPEAIHLARKARRAVVQNLSFSVLVIITLVISVLLGRLNLPLAVVGHEGSTILVAFNGLRLLLTRTRVAG